MGMYILLILAELTMAVAVKIVIWNKARQEYLIAKFGMIMLFLLLALKKYTVGIDISGYKDQYELARIMPWSNFDYVYFENGYLLLTKIFSKAGVSFQLFMACTYAALCHAVYLLIRKYSPSAIVSITIFIGYNFLVFSISGVRQTLAMAICTYAFLSCAQYSKKGIIAAIILTATAVSIHESAIVFFAVLGVMLWMNREMIVSAWVILTIAVLALRTQIWAVVYFLYGQIITDLSVSETFIFLTGMTFFAGFTYYYYKSKHRVLNVNERVAFHYDAFLLRAVFLCLMCHVVFAGGTLVRANMYFTLMLIPGIPLWTSKYPYQLRMLLNLAMIVLQLALFADSLSINQFEMCPYLFFWQ